jgi:hypothetical protein
MILRNLLLQHGRTLGAAVAASGTVVSIASNISYAFTVPIDVLFWCVS